MTSLSKQKNLKRILMRSLGYTIGDQIWNNGHQSSDKIWNQVRIQVRYKGYETSNRILNKIWNQIRDTDIN